MQDALHRLYKTKLTLLATLLTAVGLLLLIVAHWAKGLSDWAWLNRLPVADIGSGLFTSGLIAIAWQYFTQRDADVRTMQLFRDVLDQEAPAIRNAVIDGFAFEADDLARVASPATLDQIARNTLALQLGDRQLAADVYTDIRQQVIHAAERRYGVNVSVVLSPWNEGPTHGDDAMFVATVRWEYRVAPVGRVMCFSCVSDLDEYRELLRDSASAGVWYFQPKAGLNGASDEVFELVQFTVDGKPIKIRRSKRKTAQTFTAMMPDEDQREVTVAYTYRALVQQHGHLLYLDIDKPTKGLKIGFSYGGCGIRYVNTLDFVASAQPTRIAQSPGSVPTQSVEISFDGWVFPRSGVAFVWVLDEELSATKRDANRTV